MEYQSEVIHQYAMPIAILTLDLKNTATQNSLYPVCQSCQCHCHLCRGHRAPTLDEISVEKVEALFAKTLKQ